MQYSEDPKGLNSSNCHLRSCKTDFTKNSAQQSQDARKLLMNSRLLIVSDDHIFCMMLSNMLANEGCHVTRAFSGELALKLLNENPHQVDLIILDNLSILPSWLYLIDRLSTTPIIEKIPLIILAQKTETFYISTAIRYAVFDILYKPIEDHLLLNTVNSALLEKRNMF